MELPVGRSPASDETLITWPCPEARRWATAATVTCQVPMTLTSKMRRHTSGEAASRSSWGMTCGGAGVVDQDVEPAVPGHDLVHQVPGLLLVGHVGLDVAGVGELGGQGLARPRSSVDELMTTVAPRPANRRAVAAPMPDDEPVTRTVCPSKVGRRGWRAERRRDRAWAECRTGRDRRFSGVRLVSMMDGRPRGPGWWSATRSST